MASPTVSLKGLFVTLVIDAFERRDVATFDINGAYLHVKMPDDKTILLKLDGVFVNIMCQINPEYKQHTFFKMEGKSYIYGF